MCMTTIDDDDDDDGDGNGDDDEAATEGIVYCSSYSGEREKEREENMQYMMRMCCNQKVWNQRGET